VRDVDGDEDGDGGEQLDRRVMCGWRCKKKPVCLNNNTKGDIILIYICV